MIIPPVPYPLPHHDVHDSVGDAVHVPHHEVAPGAHLLKVFCGLRVLNKVSIHSLPLQLTPWLCDGTYPGRGWGRGRERWPQYCWGCDLRQTAAGHTWWMILWWMNNFKCSGSQILVQKRKNDNSVHKFLNQLGKNILKAFEIYSPIIWKIPCSSPKCHNWRSFTFYIM